MSDTDVKDLIEDNEQKYFVTNFKPATINISGLSLKSESRLNDSQKENNELLIPNQYIPEKEQKISRIKNLVPHAGHLIDWTLKDAKMDLTVAELFVIFALCRLLKDLSVDGDYSGNCNNPNNINWGGRLIPSVGLIIEPNKLYKEYFGGNEYSGKHVKNLLNIVGNLAKKEFVFSYVKTETFKEKNGCTRTVKNEIETTDHLITYAENKETVTVQKKTGDPIIKEKKYFSFILSPIFTDQITTKYVKLPRDIRSQMITVTGGAQKISKPMMNLIAIICRARSANNKHMTYYYETLVDQLGLQKDYDTGRKKEVKTSVDNALSTSVKLELMTYQTEQKENGKVLYSLLLK